MSLNQPRNPKRLKLLSARTIHSLTILALPIAAVLAMGGMSMVRMAPSTSAAVRIMMAVVWVGILWFLGVSLARMVALAAEVLHQLLHPRPQPVPRFQPRLWPPQLTHQRKLQPKHRSLTLLRHHTAQLHRAGLLNVYPRAGWVQARLRRQPPYATVKNLPLHPHQKYALSHLRAYRLASVRQRRFSPQQMSQMIGQWNRTYLDY